ncbi:Membrane-bound lytic murein transglycosylase B [hydrothermal vent metagenome]|uniref:Membrane-bound lytic murein transglycosylase B n=1 Tax=hydrothermal vent metagenome TaxID=652676 RepID=A0A3B0XUJ1_9ZZZZ
MKNQLVLKKISVFILFLSLLPVSAYANYSQRKDVQEFITKMHKEHGFDVDLIRYWMSGVEQQKTALEAISRPAEGVLTWAKYRKIFMNDSRINKGVTFWKNNADLLARAEKEYGVSAQIIVAIIGVETYYGKRAGNYRVLDALTTLGFDYPIENTTAKRRDAREIFFRKELKEFLLMTREEKVDPRKLKGSYAGAMGMPQFIPSSFRAYAIDFDGSGSRDFWNGSADSIGSVANYFKKHGWKKGQPVASRAAVDPAARELGSKKMKPQKSVAAYKKLGVNPIRKFDDAAQATLLKLSGKNGDEYWMTLNNFYVITRYNHSPLYAMAVYQLSQAVAIKYNAQLNANK